MSNTKKTYEVDYLADGTEKIIDLSKGGGTGTVILSTPDSTATFTPTSVTVTPKQSNVTLTNGGSSGITYSTGTGVSPTWVSTNGTTGTMHAKDLVLDGVSLKQLLEERLNLLIPHPELEAEWDQLKELGDQYRKLENELKEKQAVWKKLKAKY